tara:strand:- start:788 stop:931 length:144 start_codon:yes stop_codon:yes gene_type:complete
MLYLDLLTLLQNLSEEELLSPVNDNITFDNNSNKLLVRVDNNSEEDV